MKATLGIGFEERSDAFDFSIALGDERKLLGMEVGTAQPGSKGASKSGKAPAEEPKQDYSLKEGQIIHIELGGKGRRTKSISTTPTTPGTENAALFSIAPPPGSSAVPTLAPPKSAAEVRASRSPSPSKAEAQQLGFDDGDFGEFQ